MWVYIDGIVKIDTYAGTDSTADYVASKLLEHLPQQHGVRTVPFHTNRYSSAPEQSMALWMCLS